MRRLAASILVAALAVATAGCFNPFAPRIAANRGISVPAPVPDSPRNVLLLFQWCWEHRDYTKYREIFTDDFRYVDTGVDSAGNTELSQVQTRDGELESAKRLFVGGKGDEPPANRITLDFNSDLVALPDLRPGKTDQTYHKVIQTTVTLNVDTDAQNFRILDDAVFFLVRGDSAVIPHDLGFLSDPNRWYIERWEDRGGSGPAAVTRGILAARRRIAAQVPPAVEARALSSGGLPRRSVVRAAGRTSTLESDRGVVEVSWTFLQRLYR